MTFTNTLPKTEGFYLWKHPETGRLEMVRMHAEGEYSEDTFLIEARTNEHVKDMAGQWCRMVPAAEMEKAAAEFWTIRSMFDGWTFSEAWHESRAKRVAEGLE